MNGKLVGSYMKILLGAAIIMSGMLATVSLAPERAFAAVTNLYASPTGSGSTCSEGSPCSLSGVQTKVRTLNGSMSGDIIVHLRGGTYSMTSPLTLNGSDSGTNGYMVRYQAYSGETPIFEGGQAVTGWTLHDAGKNIYKANVGNRQFRQLYVADQRAIRARTPNRTDAVTEGPYHTAVSVNGSTFVVNASQIANWANLNQVELVWRGHWMQKIGRIQSYSVNGSQATIAFQSPEAAGFVDRSYTDMATTYFHFENAYEFLDAEGEWYLNTSQQTLYYKPRSGENMSTISVMTPVTESLVNVTGTSSQPVHHVAFKGITFQHSNWTKPSSYGLVDGQAMVQLQSEGNALIPGAVNVSNANNLRFEGNTFKKTGAHGLHFRDNLSYNTVTGNTFTDLSAGALYSYSDNSSYDTFSYNLVEKYGQYYTGAVGIYASRPDHMSIDHNTVRYGRYSGISLGWAWDDSETGTSNNQITNNLVHNVMQLHDDGGGIYSLGKQTNGLRSGNYIHSITRSPYMDEYPIAGIYLDNGSSFITIENNVLNNTVHAFYGRNTPNHDNVYQNNYYNVERGHIDANNVVQNNTYVSGAWPSGAQAIIDGAGTTGSGSSGSTIHIEAESYNSMSGISNYGTTIGGTDGGDWVRYNSVNLDSGYSTFTARYAKGSGGNGSVEIRLDNTTGPLVGTLTLAPTGGWTTFTTATTSLTGANGMHDVYLVFPSGTGHGDFDWLAFSGVTTPTPSSIHLEVESYNSMSGISNYGTTIGGTDGGDWMRYNSVNLGSGYSTFSAQYAKGSGGNGSVQIRLDSTSGTLIGTLTLAPTGGWTTFTTATTSLTGASGMHDVYLVFPSGTGNGDFDWLEFSGGTSAPQPFITNQTLTTLRSDYTGEVGMKFTTGGSTLTVKELGRWVASGNNGTHTIKIVNASTLAVVASVSLNTLGKPTGFNYTALSSPVTLSASTAYYLVSTETSGGDQWYHATTAVVPTSIATVNHPVYWNGTAYVADGSTADRTFGPVSFKY